MVIFGSLAVLYRYILNVNLSAAYYGDIIIVFIMFIIIIVVLYIYCLAVIIRAHI